MKQLKNEVTILTGAKSDANNQKTLHLAGNGAKVVRWDLGEVNRVSMVKENSKVRRKPIFIKAHPLKPENNEATVTDPVKPSFIDIAGTVMLVGVVLTILILFFFFGNGINIAKPIFR